MAFRTRRVLASIFVLLAFSITAAAWILMACQDVTPGSYTAPRPQGDRPAPLAAIADTGPTSKSRPFHERVFVVGWSLAGGFGTSREIGFDTPLALVLDQMIKPEHTPVAAKIGGAFFQNPAESGKLQLADAFRADPTLLVAIDFPFWFVYGMALTEKGRLERLELCLDWLSHFKKIPVVVGTCPSLIDGKGFVTDVVLSVDKDTLTKANTRIREWAAAQPNVLLVDLATLIDDVRAKKAVTLGPNSFPKDSEKRLIQPDGLHPTFEAECAIAAYALDLVRRKTGASADDYRTDVSRLLDEAKRVLGKKEEAPLASFDRTIEAFMKERDIPGGQLAIAKDGRLVYAKGYGSADLERGEPVTPTALFRIASISKPITAAAVMRLVREKRLDLEQPAFALLDLKPLGDAKVDPRIASITIRHLLTHSGGFDRAASGDPMFKSIAVAEVAGRPAPAMPEDIIRWVLGRPLDFDPGTRSAYSNFGYCVLGRVIERVTKTPYEAYVKEAVLAPMGITRMRLGKTLLDDRAPGEVRYYERNRTAVGGGVFARVKHDVPAAYGGFCTEAMDSHGGWIASAVDLVRFASSLEPESGRSPLDEPSFAAMIARPPFAYAKGGETFYACGWSVRPVGDRGRNIWHNGSLPGTSTILVHLENGLTWAALFNQRSEDGKLPDGAIDGLLHRAAAAVKDWPSGDLFERNLR